MMINDCVWSIIRSKKYCGGKKKITEETPLQLDPIQAINLLEDIARALKTKLDWEKLPTPPDVPTVLDLIHYVESHVVMG